MVVGFNDSFTAELTQNLARFAPGLPVTLAQSGALPQADLFQAARVLVLPVGLATQMPDDLSLRLQGYAGQRLLVPLSAAGWVWLGGAARSEPDLARETAQALRQLSEGQEVRSSPSLNPWQVVLVVFGGVLLVQILFGLFAFTLSTLIK